MSTLTFGPKIPNLFAKLRIFSDFDEKSCRFNQRRGKCLKSPKCEERCGEATPFYCMFQSCQKATKRCGCPPEKPVKDKLGKCHRKNECPKKSKKDIFKYQRFYRFFLKFFKCFFAI